MTLCFVYTSTFLVLIHRSQQVQMILRPRAGHVKQAFTFIAPLVFRDLTNLVVVSAALAAARLSGNGKVEPVIVVDGLVPYQQLFVITGRRAGQMRQQNRVEFQTFRFVNSHHLDAGVRRIRPRV